jgi:putative transposase
MKFEGCWDPIIRASRIKSVKPPRHSPNLNAFAERSIQTLKEGCLHQFVILGERHLNHLVGEYVEFYNRCRPHSAAGSLPPCRDRPTPAAGPIRCEERLGGLLKHYYREAT